MKRKLKRFKTFIKPVNLQIKTKSPTKWLLIDRQTGETYQGNDNGYWDKLEPKIKKEK